MRLSMSFSALSWSLCRIAPLTSSPRPCARAACAQRVRSVCVSEVVRARDISECKQADHAE